MNGDKRWKIVSNVLDQYLCRARIMLLSLWTDNQFIVVDLRETELDHCWLMLFLDGHHASIYYRVLTNNYFRTILVKNSGAHLRGWIPAIASRDAWSLIIRKFDA